MDKEKERGWKGHGKGGKEWTGRSERIRVGRGGLGGK